MRKFKSQLGSPEWEEEEDMVEVELGQAHQEYVNVQIVDTKQKKTPGIPCRNTKCPQCGTPLCGAD